MEKGETGFQSMQKDNLKVKDFKMSLVALSVTASSILLYSTICSS